MDVPVVMRKASHGELYVAGAAGTVPEQARNYDANYGLSALTGNEDMRFGAFSMGRAYITVDVRTGSWTGLRACADLRQNAWSFILFSVATGTDGEEGSIYEDTGASGGDLYSHILEGSEQYVPEEWVGKVHRARAGTEMGISDMISLDSYGYAQLTNPQVEGYGEFYFVLTPGTEHLATWITNANHRNAATIHRVAWQGTSWLTPQVYLDQDDLGLDEDDVIDALTVDAERGVVLLSTKRQDLNYQLWLVDALSGYAGPYYTKNGLKLYAKDYLKLDAATDDIDAFCADDPILPENEFDLGARHLWRAQMTAAFLPDAGSAGVNCSAHRVSFKHKGSWDRYHMAVKVKQDALATLWAYTGTATPTQVASYPLRANGKAIYKRPYQLSANPNAPNPWIEPYYYWTVASRGVTKTSRHFQFVR